MSYCLFFFFCSLAFSKSRRILNEPDKAEELWVTLHENREPVIGGVVVGGIPVISRGGGSNPLSPQFRRTSYSETFAKKNKTNPKIILRKVVGDLIVKSR